MENTQLIYLQEKYKFTESEAVIVLAEYEQAKKTVNALTLDAFAIEVIKKIMALIVI